MLKSFFITFTCLVTLVFSMYLDGTIRAENNRWKSQELSIIRNKLDGIKTIRVHSFLENKTNQFSASFSFASIHAFPR